MVGLSYAAPINVDLLNCNHCKCGNEESDSKCDTEVGEKAPKKSKKKS